MKVEQTLAQLGMAVPDLEGLYRTNPSGAHYISHFPMQNLLYLSGTTPRKDGQAYLPGVVGKDLSVAQGYEAARYAVLTTLAAVKYALGDLDRPVSGWGLGEWIADCRPIHHEARSQA